MTVAHKEVLVENELGEKKVDIPDIECCPQDFHISKADKCRGL